MVDEVGEVNKTFLIYDYCPVNSYNAGLKNDETQNCKRMREKEVEPPVVSHYRWETKSEKIELEIYVIFYLNTTGCREKQRFSTYNIVVNTLLHNIPLKWTTKNF